MLPPKYTNGQQAHEERTLHIISHQGKENQTPARHGFAPAEAQVQAAANAGEDVRKRKPSDTAGVRVKWCGRSGRQPGGCATELDVQSPCDPAVPAPAVQLRETKTCVHTDTCTWMLRATLLLITRKRKQLRHQHLMSGQSQGRGPKHWNATWPQGEMKRCARHGLLAHDARVE